jgi:hypothetical protein
VLRGDEVSDSAFSLFTRVSDSIILFDWEEKRGLGNPRYSRPGGRRYISDGYFFMLSET